MTKEEILEYAGNKLIEDHSNGNATPQDLLNGGRSIGELTRDQNLTRPEESSILWSGFMRISKKTLLA